MWRFVAWLAVTGVLLTARPASGFAVYNQTGKPVKARVGGMWSASIPPNDWKACPSYEKSCGDGTLVLTVDWFTCEVPIRKDGYAHIMWHERDSLYTKDGLPLFGEGYPRNYYCESRAADHSLLGMAPAGVRGPQGHGDDLFQREVRFLATADPQFNGIRTGEEAEIHKKSRELTAAMLKAMQARVDSEKLRGILIAGDLTSSTGNFEWRAYREAFGVWPSAVYDGIGNHDYYRLTPTERGLFCGLEPNVPNFDRSVGPNGSDDCKSPKGILDAISNRQRNTQVTYWGGKFVDVDDYDVNYTHKVTGFHYSWDWHDVHFVQLNLFPGDKASDVDGGKADPYQSLSFLKEDLSRYVGDSGRPVILVFHYPPYMEAGAWQVKFWDAIREYQVIALIVGHAHLVHDNPNYTRKWQKPAGTKERLDGAKELLTVVAGSALDDDKSQGKDREDGNIAFTEFTIGENTMSIARFGFTQATPAGSFKVLDTRKFDVRPPQSRIPGKAIPVATVMVGTGSVGRWQAHALCPAGAFVQEASLQVEPDRGGGDDSALNNVSLICSDPQATDIKSHPDQWGGWTKRQKCKLKGDYLTGARMRIEPDQGSGDDSGANDVQFRCRGADTNPSEGGGIWGVWGANVECPAGTAVCGLSIRMQPPQGKGDDTAMNGLKLHCCRTPDVPAFVMVRRESGQCLDPKGFTGAIGTPLQTFRCDGGLDQAFRYNLGDAKMPRRLTNAKSGACLLAPSRGVELNRCNETMDGDWAFDNFDTWTPIRNGRAFGCLGLHNDENIWEESCNTPAQWAAVQLPFAPRPVQAAIFLNAATGNCLDVADYDGAAGRRVGTYRCDGGLDQAFVAETAQASQKTTLKNAVRGFCVDVDGEGGEAGKTIALANCSGAADQSWTFTADPWSALVNAKKGLCLTANPPGPATLQKCDGSDKQKWVRVLLPSP